MLSNYDGGAGIIASNIEAALLGLPYEVATEYDFNFRLGYSLQGREDFHRAIELFTKNIQGDKPHLPSLYQAARSRILGQFDQEEAIAELDRYIQLADESTQPSIAAAWWRKGVAFEQLGDTAKAIECYRKSLELEPDFQQAKEALEKLENNK